MKQIYFVFFILFLFLAREIPAQAPNQFKFTIARLKNSLAQFPAGTITIHVTKENSNYSIAWLFDKNSRSWHKLTVAPEQIAPRILTPNLIGSDRSETIAFLNDIELTLYLAKERRSTGADRTQYLSFITKTEEKFKKVIKHKELLIEKWPIIQNKLKNIIAPYPHDRVLTLSKYRQLIAKSEILPQNIILKILNETLFVPLSLDWIQSNVELSHYFEQWKKNLDFKFSSGQSGEGIERVPQNNNDDFFTYFTKLNLLKNFVLQLDSDSLSETSEYKWLASTNLAPQSFILPFNRAIFIHRQTWKLKIEDSLWADFICIAQDIGPIPSNPLFSVLIHELNVNTTYSHEIFPEDTHQDKTNAINLWKSGVDRPLPTDAENIAQILAINPFMSSFYISIYLNVILNELELN